MFGTSYEHSIDRFYSHDDLNAMLNEYRVWNLEDENIHERRSGIYTSWEMNFRRDIRNQSILNTDISAERMVRRSMWENDMSLLTVGKRVIKRVHTDTNVNTRVRQLFEHLDTQIYIITAVNCENRLASLKAIDDDSLIIENVPLRDLAALDY
ncbi:hypothetical protein DMUE_5579 [Dictyocoela muelleri]|nr:hypothetical protein DMUE_5579 [Dictyocoela muelleri]